MNEIELKAQHHPASDRYYLVSEQTDEFGVPLVEVQVNRATIEGEDQRQAFALFLWQLVKDEPLTINHVHNTDQCDPLRGYHSMPHRGCILR